MIRLPVGGRIAVYNADTGRHVVVDPDGVAAAEARLAVADPAALAACRSRLPLALPDGTDRFPRGLWRPVPFERTAGGHAWTLEPLPDDAWAAWNALDDRHPADDPWVRRWMSPELQLVQRREKPPGPQDPALLRLLSPDRPENLRTPDQRGSAGETTLTAWHLAIADGPTHFDDVETTVAHAHGLPHAALGGQRYGERLADVLGGPFGTVVEVGCGDGELAASFPRARAYVRVDLSPNLLRTQAARAPETRGVLADAVRLPIRDASVDLLLCNEVIADLSASPDTPEVAAFRARYGLPAARTYNLGAWKLVQEVARVLAPGGRAFVSEFGAVDDEPEEAVQLDHPEVSIRFSDLATIARAHGLRADIQPLDAFLRFDLHARQLARVHHEALRALFRAHGRHFEARAREPGLQLPWRVQGLRFVPCSEPGAGPLITRFQALFLQKS